MKLKSTCLLTIWTLSTLTYAQVIAPVVAEVRYSEEDMLPVRSTSLTPGSVERRRLSATGLPAFFIIGDDLRSRTWLKQRLPTLIKLNAVGLVVNIESKAALDNLRQVATGLTLTPVSADDLALRLNLRHYPVLITASSLEQ
ncbi:integrating conjugative element protein [Pseudomonas synxantha]|uniref:Integrating conjugative element protein (TIGR03765 family) n=1 Tax=Pseudomonas synxantha TaxID=47883 RepID=A0ACC6JVI6_9PSED|nr:integrating conjugative element protein [Pseudomonas synxantha]MDR6610552.1 integrating conjugative element protein (TIGR03765 family) [Pseudomonas synxantha]